MRLVLAACIAYLLGSVLPAELFARACGIDIRKVGTGNPGTTNALNELGLIPGVVTGAYDTSVGLVSLWIAQRLGLPVGQTYLVALVSIVGHCLPLYSRFRGGQGMAASTGLILFGIGFAVQRGWLSVVEIVWLAVAAAGVFIVTWSASVVGVLAVPVLFVELALGRPEWQFALFMATVTTWIWLVQLYLALKGKCFRIGEPLRALARRVGDETRGR
jgi:glycerol-3-phosphate acyltransferase PlsY